MNIFGKVHRGLKKISNFLSNSCGVAILIRPNMSFDLRFVKHIVKGRCIHLCIAIKNIFLILLMYTHHRIYVSTFLKSHIQCITSTPCLLSYHDSVNAVFCLPSSSRKKSYWKLNVPILEDVEYIHLVHQFCDFWSDKKQVFQTY